MSIKELVMRPAIRALGLIFFSPSISFFSSTTTRSSPPLGLSSNCCYSTVMNSFFSTSQLAIPAPPDLRSSTFPKDDRHVQIQRNISTPQSHDPSIEPFTLISPIPITPTLLLNAHAALNPCLIKRKCLLGDSTVWELFLKPLSSGHSIGHSLLDYSPFHAIAPQELKDTEEKFFTHTWVIERLQGFLFPQPICIKTRAVCL
jgi:hypothetical protein